MINRVLLVMILLNISVNAQAVSITTPEQITQVALSEHNVNRFVCQTGDINDVYYNKEAFMVEVNANNAFVRFLSAYDGLGNHYLSGEFTLHITCGGEVYTILASPENVHAQTVYLAQALKERMAENVKLYAPLPIEAQALDLTLRAIKDELPDSFIQTLIDPDAYSAMPNIIAGVTLYKTRTISVDGLGLRLTQYIAKADQNITLDETELLDARLGDNMIAVSVYPPQINPATSAQIYIVERGME